MTELKPCPFCGEEPNLTCEHPQGETYYIIYCNCDIGPSFNDTDELQVIDVWNTRKPHPAIKAVFEKWKKTMDIAERDDKLNLINYELWQAIRETCNG